MDTITKTDRRIRLLAVVQQLRRRARVHAATQRLIDALGCGLGAHDCEPAQIGRRLAAGETPGKYPGRVLFHGDRRRAEVGRVHQHRDDPQFRFQRPLAGRPSERCARRADRARRRDAGRWPALPRRHDGDVRDLRAALRLDASSAGAAGTRALRQHRDRGRRLQSARSAAAGHRQRDRHRGDLEPAAARHALGRAHAVEERRDRLCGAQRPVRGAASPPKAWRARATRSRARMACSRTSPGRSARADFPTEGGASLTPHVQFKYWPVETNGQPVVWAALELRKSLAAARHQGRSRSSPTSSPGSRSAASRRSGTRRRARPPTTACPTSSRARWSTGRSRALVHRRQGARPGVAAADGEDQGHRRRRDRGHAAANGAAGRRPRPTAPAYGRDRQSARPPRQPDAGQGHRGEVQCHGRAGARARTLPPALDALWRVRDADDVGALFGLLDLKPH